MATLVVMASCPVEVKVGQRRVGLEVLVDLVLVEMHLRMHRLDLVAGTTGVDLVDVGLLVAVVAVSVG